MVNLALILKVATVIVIRHYGQISYVNPSDNVITNESYKLQVRTYFIESPTPAS